MKKKQMVILVYFLPGTLQGGAEDDPNVLKCLNGQERERA